MNTAQGYQSNPGVTATVRPITEAERRVALAVPKPPRYNAIGISVVAMMMAVMVNFVDDPIAMIMPLFFGVVGLGLAVQARRSSGAVMGALAKGTVTDVRGPPRWKRGLWDMGAFSIPRNSRLEGALVDGVPASVTIMPEAKHVLSVNGVPLRKPVAFNAPAGFQGKLVPPAVMPASRPVPPAVDDELPPPPDGWASRSCPQCGKNLPEGAAFCDKCGYRMGS